mgnify:CR=1 FL=1
MPTTAITNTTLDGFEMAGENLRTCAQSYGYCIAEGRLRVDVRDSGPGVPLHLREAIFERFRQGDRFEVRSHKGMGAGLALARGLARMMGGDVVLLDDERAGAHFRVEIPCAVPASAQASSAA